MGEKSLEDKNKCNKEKFKTKTKQKKNESKK